MKPTTTSCSPPAILVPVLVLLLGGDLAGQSLPPGFVKNLVTSDLEDPTSFTFAPDGRIFIAQLTGEVRVLENGVLLETPLLSVPVRRDSLDSGMFTVIIDPSFADNGWIYLYYTTPEPRDRISRFTVSGNTSDPATEFVVWETPDLVWSWHHGGGMAFGADGKLYLAMGEQFNSSHSQDPSNPYGKLLRFNPDGSIPADNPWADDPLFHPAIFALGLRNPFRVCLDEVNGDLWIGDVGGNGPFAWEEIDRAIAGVNYGWPYQEGEYCWISDCDLYTYPEWAYKHDDPAYYYDFAQASITLGPVYHASMFPYEYQDNLFVADYSNRWIRRLVIDRTLGSPQVVAEHVFEPSPDSGTVVDLKIGPEGALYYLTIGFALTGGDDQGALFRVAYDSSGNVPPVAIASADPETGDTAPLLVQFDGSGSFDPDDGPWPLEYWWDFGDGQTSSEVSPSHEYSMRGEYTCVPSVDDGAATVQAAPLRITVGHAPKPVIETPPKGTRYRAGEEVFFSGSATDVEDGTLPESALTFEVRLIHEGHEHPFLGPWIGIQSGSFIVPDQGHPPEHTRLKLILTASDSDGIVRARQRILFPLPSHFRIDTFPSGIPILLDGQYEPTPRDYTGLENYLHGVEAQDEYVLGGIPYRFVHWSDGGDRIHTFRAPTNDQNAFVLRAEYLIVPR